jgi:hypothetical protein
MEYYYTLAVGLCKSNCVKITYFIFLLFVIKHAMEGDNYVTRKCLLNDMTEHD